MDWFVVPFCVGALYGGDIDPNGGGPLEGWWVAYGLDVNGGRWDFTLEVVDSQGEFVFDTGGESDPSLFGKELVNVGYDPAMRAVDLQGFRLEDDQQIITASYDATLDGDGLSLLDGTWDGPGVISSDFWVGVKAGVHGESSFDVDADGWSGALRWDETAAALAVGAGLDDELVAPAEFLGDWSWRGAVPTLLSFEVAWTGETDPSSGPVVTLTGGGGAARFVVDDAGAYAAVDRRTYIVPMRGDFGPLRPQLWEREGEVSWTELLKNIDGLKINPGSGSGGEFLVDEVRLLKPIRKEVNLVEWNFEGGNLAASSGSGNLKALDYDWFSFDVTPWPEALAFKSVSIGGAQETITKIPEVPNENPGATFLDSSPSLGLEIEHSRGNGGGQRVNEYSLVWDLKLVGETVSDAEAADPPADLDFYRKSNGVILMRDNSVWGGMVFTDLGRISGGDSLDTVGSGPVTGGRDVVRDQWTRIVLTVNATAGELDVYVDGVKVFDEQGLPESKGPRFDGRYSLSFDGSDEDFPRIFGYAYQVGNELDLAGLAMLDMALPSEQVAALGTVGSGGILSPVFAPELAIDLVELPGQMTLGFDPSPGWRYLFEKSEDLCRWEPNGPLHEGLGGRVQVEVGLIEHPAGYFRIRPVVD